MKYSIIILISISFLSYTLGQSGASNKYTNIPRVFVYQNCIGYYLYSRTNVEDMYQFFEVRTGMEELFQQVYDNETLKELYREKETFNSYNGHHILIPKIGVCDCLVDTPFNRSNGWGDSYWGSGVAWAYIKNIPLPKGSRVVLK